MIKDTKKEFVSRLKWIVIGEYYTIDGQRWRAVGKSAEKEGLVELSRVAGEGMVFGGSTITIHRSKEQILNETADSEIRKDEIDIARSTYGRRKSSTVMARRKK